MTYFARHYEIDGRAACGRDSARTQRSASGTTGLLRTTLPAGVTCARCQRHIDVRTYRFRAKAEEVTRNAWRARFPVGARIFGYGGEATVVRGPFEGDVTIRWDNGQRATLNREQAEKFKVLSE